MIAALLQGQSGRMRTLLALVLLLAAPSAAHAYCVSVPDDRTSAYVRNGLRHTLCLADELSAETRARNRATATGAVLEQLQRDRLQHRFAAPVFADPFAPRWP